MKGSKFNRARCRKIVLSTVHNTTFLKASLYVFDISINVYITQFSLLLVQPKGYSDMYMYQTQRCVLWLNCQLPTAPRVYQVPSYFPLFNFITVTSHERHHHSNLGQLDCFFNSWFMLKTKKTNPVHYWPPCEGNPTVTGGFPAQRASNPEIVFMSIGHHITVFFCAIPVFVILAIATLCLW